MLDGARVGQEIHRVTRYRMALKEWPVASGRPLKGRDTLSARRVVLAPCARQAACELAAPYVGVGLVVD